MHEQFYILKTAAFNSSAPLFLRGPVWLQWWNGSTMRLWLFSLAWLDFSSKIIPKYPQRSVTKSVKSAHA